MPAVERQDAAGRVLDGRDRVDVFRLHAARLQPVEDRRQRIDADAVLVERHADDVDAAALQLGQRTAVGIFLDQDGVARREEKAADDIDALARARGDQDVIARAGDGAMAAELAGDEIAQALVALRPLCEIVKRQLRAFPAQHGGGGIRHRVDRDLHGIVVAADEVEFGKAREARRRVRQVWYKQPRGVEGARAHGACFSLFDSGRATLALSGVVSGRGTRPSHCRAGSCAPPVRKA